MKTMAVVGAMIALVAALPTGAGAAPIDFSSTGGVDISTTDIVETGFSFTSMFGEHTMLILGVMFAATAIGFIIWLWRKLPKFGK